MADFEVWHVLPPGAMPTVRQVLECGGGEWHLIGKHEHAEIMFRINTFDIRWAYKNIKSPLWHFQTNSRVAVVNPRPLDAPMPTPEQVGESSRWVVLSMHGPFRPGDDVGRLACTMRVRDGQVEVLFDEDDEWRRLAPMFGYGMTAVREGDR